MKIVKVEKVTDEMMDNSLQSQRLAKEVGKSFNKLISLFEDVKEYSDAVYWVLKEKKRLGLK